MNKPAPNPFSSEDLPPHIQDVKNFISTLPEIELYESLVGKRFVPQDGYVFKFAIKIARVVKELLNIDWKINAAREKENDKEHSENAELIDGLHNERERILSVFDTFKNPSQTMAYSSKMDAVLVWEADKKN